MFIVVSSPHSGIDRKMCEEVVAAHWLFYRGFLVFIESAFQTQDNS